MTTIGFIGSGHIGGTVARLAVDAGHDVVVSNSRGPETLQSLVTELGSRARAGTTQEAAATDLVVLSIPLKSVAGLPPDLLAGRVVIDTSNYYPQRDGQIPELDARSVTTSELVASQLPAARLVKAFNNINYLHLGALQRPAGSPDRSVLSIAGDDTEAKQAATAFIESLGYDAYDAGSLADSWRQDVGTPAYGAPYSSDSSGAFPPPAGSERRVTAEAMRAALAEATR